MQPTILYRHRRENLKKCSLRGLEKLPNMNFYTYPIDPLPDLSGYILLGMDAPALSIKDKNHPLFLIDGTWRYAEKMFNQFHPPYPFIIRSIPNEFVTAYPRRQPDCPDPDKGLSSIEALYLAYVITGRCTDGLLDNYLWKDSFLEKNSLALKKYLFSN